MGEALPPSSVFTAFEASLTLEAELEEMVLVDLRLLFGESSDFATSTFRGSIFTPGLFFFACAVFPTSFFLTFTGDFLGVGFGRGFFGASFGGSFFLSTGAALVAASMSAGAGGPTSPPTSLLLNSRTGQPSSPT